MLITTYAGAGAGAGQNGCKAQGTHRVEGCEEGGGSGWSARASVWLTHTHSLSLSLLSRDGWMDGRSSRTRTYAASRGRAEIFPSFLSFFHVKAWLDLCVLGSITPIRRALDGACLGGDMLRTASIGETLPNKVFLPIDRPTGPCGWVSRPF